ncbi:exonuclease RNase T and DNA polymerase III [Auriculariales sp. MPI-PUGE-AT-0066]|nr:exonuclease RNase T and DNA polymerase III [Auriculariales sp. MPI-PUGE-AT-0066]
MSESQSSSISAAADGLKYLAILDFEATCDDGRVPSFNSRKQEIIEFPVLVYNIASRQVEHTFHSYIRPILQPELTPFCTELTGIQQETVAAAEPFDQVWDRFTTFMTEKLPADSTSYTFLTCGDWDLKTMLPLQLSHIGIRTMPNDMRTWLNIKVVFSRVKSVQRPKGMVSMLNSLKLPLQGRHHSGIDDCKNISRIVTSLLESGWKP